MNLYILIYLWRALYEMCDLQNGPFIFPVLGEEMAAYWERGRFGQLWFLIWPTFIQSSKYEPWTFDLSACYSADLKLVIIAAWRVKRQNICFVGATAWWLLIPKHLEGQECPPLETSWLRDFYWRPLFTGHRNHILQEHHPHSHTLSSTGIDKNNCLETSQACINSALQSIYQCSTCRSLSDKETWHDDYDNGYVRGTMNSARDISQVLSAPCRCCLD